MVKMRRYVVANIESTLCNMRCSYCYVGSQQNKPVVPANFDYSIEHAAQALSRKRLGGVCLIHTVSSGEPLLHTECVEFSRRMLIEGHFVLLVTNMVSPRVKEILAFPPELLRRVIFHPSFHFTELKRLNKMSDYFDNVRAALRAGCSCTPNFILNEEYVPHLDEIEALWMLEMGELPQVTPVRDVERGDIAREFKGRDAFLERGAFRSTSYRVAMEFEGVKRTEFCYAGDWTIFVNLLNGAASKCLWSPVDQNIFEDITKPIRFEAMGQCRAPWCLCGPTFLSLGLIPELPLPTVAECRGRDVWLNADAKALLSGRLSETNRPYSAGRKWWMLRGREKAARLAKKLESCRRH